MRARPFFRSVYADNARRSTAIRRKLGADLIQYTKNRCLLPAENRLIERYKNNNQPVVFIVGVPRSGTTLLFQLMARFLKVGYANNYVARHWKAPIWAAKRHHQKFGDDRNTIQFDSNEGRTKGLASPHEFTWFWHDWFEDLLHYDDLTLAECMQIDEERLRGQLQGLAGFHQSPFVWKSLNFCSYQIEWLSQLLPNARFIWMTRDRSFTAQSIYLAREKTYGDVNQWWSSRPRDLHAWQDQSPEKQIAHQIFDIERAINRGFELIKSEQHMQLTYEDLVQSPSEQLEDIAQFAGAAIFDKSTLDSLKLSRRNMQRIPDNTFAALKGELEKR